MRRRYLIAVSAVMAVVVVACSGESTTTTEGTGVEEERIEMAELAFTPDTLTVASGATVVWANADETLSHTSTSDDDLWSSGNLAVGDEFSHTFDEAGTFAYFCEIHPTMRGTIVVE